MDQYIKYGSAILAIVVVIICAWAIEYISEKKGRAKRHSKTKMKITEGRVRKGGVNSRPTTPPPPPPKGQG